MDEAPSKWESTVFGRLVDGRIAQIEAENAISRILNIKLLGLSWDHYDSSFEIYPDELVIDVIPTDEQHAAILDLGCMRYWINFPNGTERYCRNERTAVEGNKWKQYNDCWADHLPSRLLMDEAKAKAALGDLINEKGWLWGSGEDGLVWKPAFDYVCIDGSFDFTADQLEAIAWWIRNKGDGGAEKP